MKRLAKQVLSFCFFFYLTCLGLSNIFPVQGQTLLLDKQKPQIVRADSIEGSNERKWFVFSGKRMKQGASLHLRASFDNFKTLIVNTVLSKERVQVNPEGTILRVAFTSSVDPAAWQIQVKNPDGEASNVFQFKVKAPRPRIKWFFPELMPNNDLSIVMLVEELASEVEAKWGERVLAYTKILPSSNRGINIPERTHSIVPREWFTNSVGQTAITVKSLLADDPVANAVNLTWEHKDSDSLIVKFTLPQIMGVRDKPESYTQRFKLNPQPFYLPWWATFLIGIAFTFIGIIAYNWMKSRKTNTHIKPLSVQMFGNTEMGDDFSPQDRLYCDEIDRIINEKYNVVPAFNVQHIQKYWTLELFGIKCDEEKEMRENYRKVRRISPKKYLMQKRLHEGRKLLTEATEPVSIETIASQVGYGKEGFQKAFKQSFGFTPTEYLNQVLAAKQSST